MKKMSVGVSIDRLLSQFKTSGARVRLAVIEASRRNPYERRFRTYSHGLAPIQTSENALILSSAAPDQVVEDPDELHSQLMTALLAQMGSSKGIEEVLNSTRNAVAAATQGQQIPDLSSTLTESVNLWRARSGVSVSAVSSAASGRRKCSNRLLVTSKDQRSKAIPWQAPLNHLRLVWNLQHPPWRRPISMTPHH